LRLGTGTGFSVPGITNCCPAGVLSTLKLDATIVSPFVVTMADGPLPCNERDREWPTREVDARLRWELKAGRFGGGEWMETPSNGLDHVPKLLKT
jgi:hypothetical protein